MSAPVRSDGGGHAQMPAPSRALGTVMRISDAYSTLVSSSRLAPVLSRSHPVRRSGYTMTLRVVQKRAEADGVVSLRLVAPDGSPLPAWTPGAHVDVVLPSGTKRQYSLCGAPADRRHYRIAVRRIPDGQGSVEIHDGLDEGDALTVQGPRNAFRASGSASQLFIAAGIGITPILPMARAAAAEGGDWRLLYLGRSRETMPFLGETAQLDSRRVRILPDDETGGVTAAQLLEFAEADTDVHVCGPAPLIEAVRERIQDLRPGCGLHFERFSSPPVVDGTPFEIRLARSAATVRVASDESALTAIRRVVPSAPYSCRQGFCGTCKVKVLHGDVEHRDSRLLPGERADSMLVCVSRSAGGPLEVDL